MIFNSLANECLPIFLHRLMSELPSVIVSVTLVLIFGEIIPSILFSGPKKYSIASMMAPLVRLLFCLF